MISPNVELTREGRFFSWCIFKIKIAEKSLSSHSGELLLATLHAKKNFLFIKSLNLGKKFETIQTFRDNTPIPTQHLGLGKITIIIVVSAAFFTFFCKGKRKYGPLW